MLSPPVLSEARPRPRLRVRALKWLAVTLGLLAAALVVFVVVLANWPDSDPPADAHMLPQWRGLGDDNPLARFETWAEENPFDSEDPRLDRLQDPASWDAAEARAVLADHSEGLARFHELVAETDAPWEWRDGEANVDVHAKFTSGPALRFAYQLALIEALLSADEGRVVEALERCIALLATSRAIEGARGPALQYVTGSGTGAAGLKTLERIAKAAPLDPDQLRSLREAVATMEPDPADLVFVLQCDYLLLQRALDTDLRSAANPEDEVIPDMPRRLAPPLQRNNTLRLHLRLAEPLVESVDQGWPATRGVIEDNGTRLNRMNRSVPLAVVYPNVAGKILVSVTYGASELGFTLYHGKTAKLRLATTMLALREFELEHGHLPERLEELVPDQLDSVPLDPFTSGQPLRWDAATGALYSVGKDESDDGGAVDPPTSGKAADYGSGYWWARDEP